jgi:proline dehydrogenase
MSSARSLSDLPLENVEPTLKSDVSAALQHLALDESAKAYVLEHQPLYKALLPAATRFIGGETLSDCCVVAKQLNERGHAVTVDFMGESTRDALTAQQATQEFLKAIDLIAKQKLNSSVSFDLSHLGMVIDPDLGYENACILAKAARAAGNEVMISMEGTDLTTIILDIHGKLAQQFDNVGITLQAFLYRTDADLNSVLQRPGKIRLCKGAYEAPPHLAMPRGSELDSDYLQLAKKLVESGHACSIATHGQTILDQAHQFIRAGNFRRDNVEFEMVKGVTPERLDAMRAAGYRTRVYLPYGREWHLYLCNRLAEHPPNIYQAIIDASAKT